MQDKIKEVYEKFKHLDNILSDESITEDSMDNFRYKILKELWEAIKYYSTTEICPRCKGEGELYSQIGYSIECQTCRGIGRSKIR